MASIWDNVAIVGATGAVGQEFLRVLEQRRTPLGRLRLLASSRSAGKEVVFAGRTHTVEELRTESFAGIRLALFSAGAGISRDWAATAVRAGAIVVDNSSAFRMQSDVPLVVPEVNADAARRHKGIIANPNCSTILLLIALAPLHRRWRVRRVVVSTYQAVSGAGAAAMNELVEQTHAVLDGRQAQPRVLPQRCAFNVFSHNSAVGEDGYNGEERKMLEESRRILDAPDLALSATCIRVPVLRAHSESVHVEFEQPVSPGQARELLAQSPGVRLVDEPDTNRFPTPVDAENGDEVLVGRIRRDVSLEDGRGLAFFLSGDQLRKGAATNAIQIAELLA